MMFLKTLQTAFTALKRNPMRALLTMLGIVIGISAVIAMMEIGEGASSQIKSSIEGLGANNINIRSASAFFGGVSKGAGSKPTITPQDCETILRDSTYIKIAAPLVRSSAQLVRGAINWTPNQVLGSSPNYLEARDWALTDGSNFTERDLRNSNKVCLIGQTIKQKMFSDTESPIGKNIRIKDNTFRVVGVLAAKGSNMMGYDQDDVVIAPWTTVKYRLSTTTSISSTSASTTTVTTQTSNSDIYPSEEPDFYPGFSSNQTKNTPILVRFTTVDEILAVARSTKEVDKAIEEITQILRTNHRLATNVEDDFSIRSMAEMSKFMSSTTELMKKLLLCVALVSLLVGGVGIMNIMLVSVTERTREIGLRMAVGARGKDILQQFIIESIVLCLVGGCLGILLGHGGALLVNKVLHWPIMVSWIAITASVGVSVIVGVIFGFYPAWKASQLDPIEALRYE